MGWWRGIPSITPETADMIDAALVAARARADGMEVELRNGIMPPELLHTRSLEQIADVVMSGRNTSDIRQLPAVTGARRLISSTIDQLGMVVMRGGQSIQTPRWLRDPRESVEGPDAGDIVQYCIDSMILHGRAFIVATATASEGQSWKLEAVNPTYVTCTPRPDGLFGRTFQWAGSTIPEVPYNLGIVAKGARYLLHIPYVVTVDQPEGTTPLRESERMLRGLLDTELHTAELFASGTHVGGILSTEFDITTEQAKAWQDAWIVARQTGRIPVLGNGLAYRNDFPNARDLQMVEARSFNQSVVWALLGIPMAYMGSSLMGGQSSLSYANAQDNRRQFADNCLRAFTTQIEDAFSRLLPHGRNDLEDQVARFDYSEWEGRADDGAQTPAADSVPPA